MSAEQDLDTEVWSSGFARLGSLMSASSCDRLRQLYDDDSRFRSTIDMQRFRFGRGEYRYFAYPLPPEVARLRETLYARLVPLAQSWMEALRLPSDYPPTLERFLAKCRGRRQKKPTPLLLRYREGDFNCLHQDVYGTVTFPFQVIVSLSDPQLEFSGGELLLVEQRPRAQTIGHALLLAKGEAVVITTRYRPARGTRGFYRTNFRHGVSRVTRGERFTLGVIFHDAT